jgi:hypothetical protein
MQNALSLHKSYPSHHIFIIFRDSLLPLHLALSLPLAIIKTITAPQTNIKQTGSKVAAVITNLGLHSREGPLPTDSSVVSFPEHTGREKPLLPA